MGNHFCYSFSQDCFSHCFGHRYIPWKRDTVPQTPNSETVNEFSRVCARDLVRRNRISEYIAQALNRSRSPLLLHDDFLPSDNSPVDSDFPVNNTNSWMSDATRSDASHRLYREVDPSYARHNSCAASNSRMVDSNYMLTASTSGDERQDDQVYRKEEATGGWVAIARLSSGSGKHTSTSAVYLPSASSLNAAVPPLVPIRRPQPPGHAHPLESTRQVLNDEEVDTLELARIARGLWEPGDRGGAAKASRRRSTATRPTVLSVSSRTANGSGQQQQYRASNNLEPTMLDTEDVSPVELDWDHEPGTTSTRRYAHNRPGLWTAGGSPPTPDDGAAAAPSTVHRPAARLLSRPGLRWPSAADPSVLCSPAPLGQGDTGAFYRAVGGGKPVDLPPDELVDSGFVGAMNTSSCADGDSDATVGLVAG